ncbi:hypothetical protein RIF29_41289 [Crotalaria pallida]|uniref:Uncharacterized protein n=1 Tax=Crotalaria pallida TaxID=3830 RepID=A0AAN9HRH2_CROPI
MENSKKQRRDEEDLPLLRQKQTVVGSLRCLSLSSQCLTHLRKRKRNKQNDGFVPSNLKLANAPPSPIYLVTGASSRSSSILSSLSSSASPLSSQRTETENLMQGIMKLRSLLGLNKIGNSEKVHLPSLPRANVLPTSRYHHLLMFSRYNLLICFHLPPASSSSTP